MPEAAGQCAVRVTRRYAAAPAEVWAALTDRASVARWLAPVTALELAPAGAFLLELPSGRVDARVRALEPERLLELDWSYAGEERSVVRFELAPDGDGTLLVLDHRRIEEPVGMAYIQRWSRAIARLDRELGKLDELGEFDER